MTATSKYRPDMCGKLVELMSQGRTNGEVAAALGVCRRTFLRWADPKGKYYIAEFGEAYRMGRVHQQAWWEREGQRNLMNRNFNTGLFALMMANMFGWRSASKRKSKEEVEIEDIKRELGID